MNDAVKRAKKRTKEDRKSGQEVAKHGAVARASRYHVDHWKARIYRKTFTRGGERHEVSEWSVRLQHLGQREAFALGSANANAAAAKAKEIAVYLEANGWEPTRAKYKPPPAAKAGICTLGEFIADVQKRSHLKAMTVRRYAVKLRKMMADVANLDGSVRSQKARRKKYDYVNGGHADWLAKVDSQRLDVLTPEKVAAWRNQYVAKIHVRRTPYFEPKTEESQRTIDLAPDAVKVLRAFMGGSKSDIVLDGSEPNPEATYDYYRCDGTWRDLNAWLKSLARLLCDQPREVDRRTLVSAARIHPMA